MNIELIVCIALAIMLSISTWMANKYWKEKEHFRCRVFELTNGKEGSHLPKTSTLPPYTPSPRMLTRSLRSEWLHTSGAYFKRSAVVALTTNPNRTVNVVLGNGHYINTMLELDDVKKVIGINFSCSLSEEMEHIEKIYKKDD